MVHNGIEYGLMAAYAEGLNILKNANVGSTSRDADAETAPLEHPEHYMYDIDVAQVAEVWRRGSVVQSWLLDLTATAMATDPDLDGFAGRVSESREQDLFADRILSAMRKQFGGHDEKKA